jgi:hypothetical protein
MLHQNLVIVCREGHLRQRYYYEKFYLSKHYDVPLWTYEIRL